MNEQELARIVRGTLDESAERLPYRIARRLAAARAEALASANVDERAAARAPEQPQIHRHVRTRPYTRPPSAARTARRAAHAESADSAGPPPRLVWRIAAVIVPVVVVAAGLLGISAWESQQRADDLAALDAAMLADDVPITAYADRGFGVFLRNVSWEAGRE